MRKGSTSKPAQRCTRCLRDAVASVSDRRDHERGAAAGAAAVGGCETRVDHRGRLRLEFRYGVGAIPALQGLDASGRVIYIGTFARMLFPALRLGYIVTPPALRDAFRAVKWLADRGSPALEQQAVASLLESGAYESLRRRSVRALTEKRDRIVAAIARHFPDAIASGASSGTHIFLRLPKLRDDARLLDAARAAGVHVYSARPYYQRPPAHAALLLGYTTVALDDIDRGVERLARSYRKTSERRRLAG